jgi:hypothetical protein
LLQLSRTYFQFYKKGFLNSQAVRIRVKATRTYFCIFKKGSIGPLAVRIRVKPYKDLK